MSGLCHQLRFTAQVSYLACPETRSAEGQKRHCSTLFCLPRAPALNPVSWSRATRSRAWPLCASDSPWQRVPHAVGTRGGQSIAWPAVQVVPIPWSEAGAEPRALPFPDLSVEREPPAKRLIFPLTCWEGGLGPGLTTTSLQGHRQSGAVQVAWGDPCP